MTAAGRGPNDSRWREVLSRRLRDRRFWAVQALLLVVTAGHWGLEIFPDLTGRNFGGLYVVVLYSIYLVPIIYASLNFGREGAIPTAVASAALAVPNILMEHQGVGRFVEGVQLFTMIALGAVIAGRVDREIAARREAEREGLARRRSEAKYRQLFDGAADAILVVDQTGAIDQANDAAAQLFRRALASLRGAPIADVLGVDAGWVRQYILQADERTTGELSLARSGRQTWLEFVCSSLRDPAGLELTQAIFRDVTERHQRQGWLESYAREMLRAQEDERRRIAREIHDDFLQSLVLLCRRLDALDETNLSGGPSEASTLSAGLRETRREAEVLVDGLRRFSSDLRPSVLDDLGLVPAIRRLVSDLQARAGMRTRLATAGVQRRLPSEIELCLFRIAQEGLRNVERHAAASRATVTLTYRDTAVQLKVVDDGVGLSVTDDTDRRPPSSKLGLLGMRERARLVGGDFHIASKPREGTTVRVSVPTDAFETVGLTPTDS